MIHIILDIIGLSGLVMLAYGLWLISAIAMFIVIGIIMLAFALFGSAGFVVVRNPYKADKG